METKNTTTCELCGNDFETGEFTYCEDCELDLENDTPVFATPTMKERIVLRLSYAAGVMVEVLKHNAVWYLAGLIDGLILHLLMR